MKLRALVPLLAVILLPLALGAFVGGGELHPAAVHMLLPDEIDGWQGEIDAPSEEERAWLAEDTTFEKRRYWDGARDGIAALREVQVGIILSGEDVNDSIHRPERCLRAQGFQQLEIRDVEIDLGGGEVLRAKRIRSFRRLQSSDGTGYDVPNLNYYWFVGRSTVTNDHYARTFRDMRDRLVGGFSQRWAYFTISTNLTDALPDSQPRDERAADELLASFAREVYRSCVRAERIER